MRASIIGVFMGVLWTAATGLSPALAQGDAARPAVGTSTIAPIGKVVKTTGSVTLEHADAVVVQASLGGQSNRPKIGDPVYTGDVVQTGADGRVGITFSDGTAFNVSSNARMVLNEFVYNPNSTSNSTLFSLTKGTFTFVAGKVAKTGDMKIDTPVATMGIRGTTPHVEITADGKVKFSTLIEEHKNGAPGRRSSLTRQRQAQDATSPAASDAAPSARTTRVEKPALTICRGC